MKRLIRNRARLYWKGDGDWTADYQQAQTFADAKSVISTKDRYYLKDVVLVLVANGKSCPQYDVVFLLKDARP